MRLQEKKLSISLVMKKQAKPRVLNANKLAINSFQWKKSSRISRPDERVTYDDCIKKCLIQKKLHTEEMSSLSPHCKTRSAQLPSEHRHYSDEVKLFSTLGMANARPSEHQEQQEMKTIAQHRQYRTQTPRWNCPAWHMLTLCMTDSPLPTPSSLPDRDQSWKVPSAAMTEKHIPSPCVHSQPQPKQSTCCPTQLGNAGRHIPSSTKNTKAIQDVA